MSNKGRFDRLHYTRLSDDARNASAERDKQAETAQSGGAAQKAQNTQRMRVLMLENICLKAKFSWTQVITENVDGAYAKLLVIISWNMLGFLYADYHENLSN